MRILLGNNTLSILAGSETWTETLAKQLKKMGHDVTAFSPQLGFVAVQLEAAGIRCVNELAGREGIRPFDFRLMEPVDDRFDLIICNHYEVTRYLSERFPRTPKIVTIHGILHADPQTGEIWPEHPFVAPNTKYVAVSEEVRDLLSRAYGLESTVIRNSFDLERFKLINTTRKAKPEVLFLNTNYTSPDDPVMRVVDEVKKHYGTQLRMVGAGFGQCSYNIEEILNGVDVVFGMGRSLLEGVLTGCLGVCHGRWGTGGVLTCENYDDISQCNFSGRNAAGKLATAEEIVAAIDAQWETTGEGTVVPRLDIADFVRKNHDIEKAAEAYLSLV